MTGTDLQHYVESRLGRTFEPDEILEAINECIDEIGDMNLLYATIDISVDDTDQWYNLPDDYTKVVKVIKYKHSKEYIYEKWQYRNGKIRIPEGGTYKIVARKLPEYLENIAEPLNNIHRLYNNAFKYYVLGWIRENEDLDDQTAKVMFERFREKTQRAATTLISTKSPAQWKVIRHG